jgi:hypothetical protein
MEWAGHTYRMEKSRTPKNILEGKIYGFQQAGKLKDRGIDAMTGNAKRLLGTTGCNRLSLNQKILGRKTEEARV